MSAGGTEIKQWIKWITIIKLKSRKLNIYFSSRNLNKRIALSLSIHLKQKD